MSKPAQKQPSFLVYLFDEENVVLKKSAFTLGVDGEITGKKGDAFRASLDIQQFELAKAKKAEFRPTAPPIKK